MIRDVWIEDFTEPAFCQAFQLYFQELGIQVRDWEVLFREMNTDGRGDRALVRMEGDRTVGFIQLCPMEMEGWFYAKRLGFIREFWIAPEYRGRGHGKALLALAEGHFTEQGVNSFILTTCTAPGFYEKAGYRLDKNMRAKNHEPVYVKEL